MFIEINLGTNGNPAHPIKTGLVSSNITQVIYLCEVFIFCTLNCSTESTEKPLIVGRHLLNGSNPVQLCNWDVTTSLTLFAISFITSQPHVVKETQEPADTGILRKI